MGLMKNSKSVLNRYYCPRSSCKVLGCLMLNPSLVNSKTYKLEANYFLNKNHRILFETIKGLADNGLNEITLGDVENYLYANSTLAYNRFFEIDDMSEWILALIEDANLSNYEYYHGIVQKYSYLRDMISIGFDVSDILDETEIESSYLEEQRQAFYKMDLNSLIKHYTTKMSAIRGSYTRRGIENSRKAGEGVDELLESFKKAPEYGWRTVSPILDGVVRGARRRAFSVISKDSGVGKTRIGVKQLCILSCEEMWDEEAKDFVPNPYGQTVPTLYMGTEMDLYREIEPIILSTISGVDEHKIKTWELTDKELERVNRAKEISKNSPIYLENEPNYDCAFIYQIVEQYVSQHNIGAFILDYVELTPNLSAEYAAQTKGMQVRPDMVLFNLSTQLKTIANEFDIYVEAYTQVSDNARQDYHIRDSSAIKDAKSLQMRADIGITCFRPTEKELKNVEELTQKCGYTPNMVINLYKNRGGRDTMIKIWQYVDLGNMRTIDLFATDWNYKGKKLPKANLKYFEPTEVDEIGVEQCDPDPLDELESDTVEIYEDFPFDEETGEIIEQPKRLGRAKSRRH